MAIPVDRRRSSPGCLSLRGNRRIRNKHVGQDAWPMRSAYPSHGTVEAGHHPLIQAKAIETVVDVKKIEGPGVTLVL